MGQIAKRAVVPLSSPRPKCSKSGLRKTDPSASDGGRSFLERRMSMETSHFADRDPRRKTPWNKGKFTGAKPPLQPKHVWAIRTRLQIASRTRDLALFNLAIDSKLRGCDVVSVKVEDVAPHGYTVDRATIRQRKTGRPVKFEITEQTRQAIDDHLAATRSAPERLSIPRAAPRSSPHHSPVCAAARRMAVA